MQRVSAPAGGREGRSATGAISRSHNPILPLHLTDGASLNASGQIWRRLHLGEWEYKQDPETLDDHEARQY
ncbi:hypothetical protein [Rhizobium etli]|uniref:hypothetical protein n=1 Tax=Rhizobium etli TaxID=29449 RepID=UPI001FEEEABA|nr:hypothetical protein [Rhizobium etli]